MPIKIFMPALSPTMTEGNLVKWNKKEGDSIKPGDVIAEIETDKATMEVEAVDEGVIGKILVSEGTENVKVNTLIALLLEEGEDASALNNVASMPASPSSPSPTTKEQETPSVAASKTHTMTPSHGGEGAHVFASPLAKRIAQEHNINLTTLQGSGPHGRIIKADIERTIASGGAPSMAAADRLAPLPAIPMGDRYKDISLSNMRKVIAKRLTESKQNVPHFYLTVSCEIDALLKLRTQINKERAEDQKISVNDFVLKACIHALQKVPEANVTWHDNFIRQYDFVDISMAVAIDGGLLTPVIREGQNKSLGQVSQDAKDLIAKARAGKLMPEDYQGGTFTVSNLGMFGISHFGAIINPPQACILAVGAGEKKAVVKDDQITMATVMTCTLSVDHRAVDGALGARFLSVFKQFIENPVLILV